MALWLVLTYIIPKLLPKNIWSEIVSILVVVINNKKVLLRERKRHTARRVASIRGVPTLDGGGRSTYLGWGVPTLGYLPPS